MIRDFVNSPTALPAFTAAMGLLTCTYLAFANRRYYDHAPRFVAVGYRGAWLTAAAAWLAEGVQAVLGVHGRAELVAPATMVAAALIGLYFGIHMRQYAGPGR